VLDANEVLDSRRLASPFACGPSKRNRRRPGLRYTQVYALNPREGVFAYARILPDGRRLV